MASIQKRVNKDGKASYRVQVRVKGYPSEVASFERLTDAKQWAQDTESAIRNRKHFPSREAKKYTLSDAIDRYHKDVLSQRKNPVNQMTYLKWWKSELGAYSLAALTSDDILKKRSLLLGSVNEYGRKVGSTTANRYTQSLGHVLNVAMKEWGWTQDNPVSKIKKYKESRGRVRFLDDEERKALLEACQSSDNPHLFLIVVLALSTGARKMEILTLKWQDIDFERGQIVLHETKNDERRTIPLQGFARELMVKHAEKRTSDCEFVFPSKKTTKDKNNKKIYQPIDIRTAWENALIKAGIENFRFHDLRHSAASYLAMNGASLAEIAEVLGHKTLQMVKRYAHLSEAHTSSVVASMNERIFGGE